MPRHRPRRASTLRLSLAVLLATPVLARADQFTFFGLGTRGASLAGAMTAIVDDQAATLYNPAGAAATPDLRVGVGGAFDNYFTSAGSRKTIEENVFIPWVGVAFPFPFGSFLKDKIYGAATISLATKHARFVRILLTPPTTPYFVAYTNSTERISVAPVLAVKPFPFLMLGAGINLFPFESPNHVAASPGVTGDLDVTGTLLLQTDIQPRGGIQVDLGKLWPEAESLRLGISFRGGFDERFALPAKLNLGFPADIDIRGRDHFEPQQLAVGIGYDPLENLTLSLDVAWQKWSAFSSPRLEVAFHGLQGLIPLEQIASLAYDPPSPDLHDTVSPRLGAELRAPSWSWAQAAWRIGYAFEPSPGPATERDPLLFANARHVIGVGFSLRPSPGAESEDPVRFELDLSAQVHVLEPQRRTVPPELSRSGREEVTTGEGTILSAGLSVNARY